MPLTSDAVAKMTVPELKAALKSMDLPITGKKDELIARCLTALLSSGGAVVEALPTAESAAPVTAEAVQAAGGGLVGDVAPSEIGSDKHEKISLKEDVQVPKTTAVKQSTVTEQDKIKLRAERFKDPEVEKQKARAQRFNLVHPDLEHEKAIKRAERFGIVHPEIEDKKKKQRAERFGIVDEDVKLETRKAKFGPIVAEDSKLQQRKERFAPLTVPKAGSDDFNARKKARADRFGL